MPSPFPSPPPEQRGTLHTLRISSEALKGNPWGDPTTRDLHVYTPPGYFADETPYPAVLVLAPFAGTGETLLARGLSEISIATRIDRLIAAGCPPFIAVMPDCMTSLVGSQFQDSAGIGDYATYIADEVRALVDGSFRTSGRWGAVGRSSGGFGALSLAMDRPGSFHAIASHAGDMGFDLCYLADIPSSISGVQAMGGLEGFVEAFWAANRPSGSAFAAMNVICMSCAYSPDLAAKPIPARFPVDFETGELDFEVLQSWRKRDPIVRVDDNAAREALAALDLLFLDAGERDEYNLQLGLRRFVARLNHYGIAHEHEEHPGGHRGTTWRLDVSLRRIADVLTADR